jgi:facilitated trehalose transporter
MRPTINGSQVPDLMRKSSSKRILNQRPLNLPTKSLRTRSLLWVKPTVTVDQLSASIIAQLVPTLLVNLAAISSGLSLGYSAIALPQLKPYMDSANVHDATFGHNIEHYRPFIVDEEQGSWIASIFGIGAIFGGFLSGYLGSQFGRRKTLILFTIPDIVGWIMIASSQNLTMMLLGRFLCGLAAAGYTPAILIYIAEIAQPHHRGWLSAVTVPSIGLGTLISYTLGSLICWHWVAVIACFFPVALIPGLLFLSDSPYWYLQQTDEKKALQVMERFRAPQSNYLNELLAIIDFHRDTDLENSWKDGLEKIMMRQYRRPFLILNFLFVLMTFSGKFAISFYAIEVLRDASNGMNEYFSAIIVGVIRLFGSLLYIPAIKYFSRRGLLCVSSFVMGVSLILLGLAVYSHKSDSIIGPFMGDLYWLPLLSVVVYMVADPLGLGSIPFLYSAEFFPTEMRSILSGVTAGLANLEMFLVVKTFPTMNDMMGSHGTYWLYAGVCFATIVFVLLFIPETKGKSLQEIEATFAYKESLHVTPYVTPEDSPMTTPSSRKRRDIHYAQKSLQFTL